MPTPNGCDCHQTSVNRLVEVVRKQIIKQERHAASQDGKHWGGSRPNLIRCKGPGASTARVSKDKQDWQGFCRVVKSVNCAAPSADSYIPDDPITSGFSSQTSPY